VTQPWDTVGTNLMCSWQGPVRVRHNPPSYFVRVGERTAQFVAPREDDLQATSVVRLVGRSSDMYSPIIDHVELVSLGVLILRRVLNYMHSQI
jgi:hypothetical protein